MQTCNIKDCNERAHCFVPMTKELYLCQEHAEQLSPEIDFVSMVDPETNELKEYELVIYDDTKYKENYKRTYTLLHAESGHIIAEEKDSEGAHCSGLVKIAGILLNVEQRDIDNDRWQPNQYAISIDDELINQD